MKAVLKLEANFLLEGSDEFMLKRKDLCQDVGFWALKIRGLHNRESQNRELQGLPVPTF